MLKQLLGLRTLDPASIAPAVEPDPARGRPLRMTYPGTAGFVLADEQRAEDGGSATRRSGRGSPSADRA